MTFRDTTLRLLVRHAAGTDPEVRERIEHGSQPEAAILCDQALEGLARRLPPGTACEHPKYGCRFEITPGGLVLRQGACAWGKRGHWCKHQAIEIDRALLPVRLAALSADLGPGPIQPPACGSCGDLIPEPGGCTCGNPGNSITARSPKGPDFLNR